jgi:hypothetical protein
MARNDGVDRISARNVNLSSGKIGNTQRHNEREKESYTNPDIVPERSNFNIHFKKPADDYEKMFSQMEADKVISTRGLKKDANLYGELIFDVNSAYFHNHGGYEFAKQFYADAYKAAVEIVGGEQYILSAVMHADERNRAMSEALNQDVFHYHMHVVYIPVVEKQILCRSDAKTLSGRHVKKLLCRCAAAKNGSPSQHWMKAVIRFYKKTASRCYGNPTASFRMIFSTLCEQPVIMMWSVVSAGALRST